MNHLRWFAMAALIAGTYFESGPWVAGSLVCIYLDAEMDRYRASRFRERLEAEIRRRVAAASRGVTEEIRQQLGPAAAFVRRYEERL